MAHATNIEWTEATWNPVTGCTKVSPGCKRCYAERMAKRLRAMGQPRYANGCRVTLQQDLVEKPLRWRASRRIFVNSMSDLFHEDVPEPFIQRVFRTMEEAHWHEFQILTKRPERLRALAKRLPWPDHVWMGVSVENQDYRWRIDHLVEVQAAVRFLHLLWETRSATRWRVVRRTTRQVRSAVWAIVPAHQWTRPSRSTKWLRQPRVRHTEGLRVSAPVRGCWTNRQAGRVDARRFNWMTARQPQGQSIATDEKWPFSPTR